MTRLSFSLLLALLGLLPLALTAQDNASPEFPRAMSAVVRMKVHGQENQAKYDMLGDKVRMELEMRGTRVVNIIDRGRRILLGLQPDEKVAMRFVMPNMPPNPLMELANGDLDLVEVGQETVNGKAAIKYETKSQMGQVLYVWMEADGSPVRIASEKGNVRFDFAKVSLTEPDAALFEIPDDYRVISVDENKPGQIMTQPTPNAPEKVNVIAPPDEQP
ncbi:MAG: hypothetical protein AAGK14_06125 [Verrucomicrobiota bacterium]